METINIITRCSRLNNLLEISDSVFNTDRFKINWYVVFDRNIVEKIDVDLLLKLQSLGVNISFEHSIQGDHGHQMINHVIDSITEGWVYILDDDNIIHPDFYERLFDTIETNSDKGGIIFHQKIGGIDFTGQDIRYSSPDTVKVSKIDMAQFFLHRDLIGEYRLPMGHYVGDGMFIESLYEKKSDSFIFIDEILCYYNYFQQVKKPNKKFLPRVLVLGKEGDVEMKSN